MIYKIIGGISNAIANEFGESNEIYINDLEQGFNSPCFFIANKGESRKIYFGKTYRSKTEFCIMYYPNSEEKQEECGVVSNRLFECLEFIEILDGTYRTYGIKSKIVENVLYFTIFVDVYYEKVEEKEFMEKLEIGGKNEN